MSRNHENVVQMFNMYNSHGPGPEDRSCSELFVDPKVNMGISENMISDAPPCHIIIQSQRLAYNASTDTFSVTDISSVENSTKITSSDFNSHISVDPIGEGLQIGVPREIFAKDDTRIFTKKGEHIRLVITVLNPVAVCDTVSVIFDAETLKNCSAKGKIGDSDICDLFIPFGNHITRTESISALSKTSDDVSTYYFSKLGEGKGKYKSAKDLKLVECQSWTINNDPRDMNPDLTVLSEKNFYVTPFNVHSNQVVVANTNKPPEPNHWMRLQDLTSSQTQTAFKQYVENDIDCHNEEAALEATFFIPKPFSPTSNIVTTNDRFVSLLTPNYTAESLNAQKSLLFTARSARHTVCVSYIKLSFRVVPSTMPGGGYTISMLGKKTILCNNFSYMTSDGTEGTNALQDAINLVRFANRPLVTNTSATIPLDLTVGSSAAVSLSNVASATRCNLDFVPVPVHNMSYSDFSSLKCFATFSTPTINTKSHFTDSMLIKRFAVTTPYTGLEPRLVIVGEQTGGNTAKIHRILPFSYSMLANIILTALYPVSINVSTRYNTSDALEYDGGINLGISPSENIRSVHAGRGSTMREAVLRLLLQLSKSSNKPGGSYSNMAALINTVRAGSKMEFMNYFPDLMTRDYFLGLPDDTEFLQRLLEQYNEEFHKYNDSMSRAVPRNTPGTHDPFDVAAGLEFNQKRQLSSITASCYDVTGAFEGHNSAASLDYQRRRTRAPVIFLSIKNIETLHKAIFNRTNETFPHLIPRWIDKIVGPQSCENLDTILNDLANYRYGRATVANRTHFNATHSNLVMGNWFTGPGGPVTMAAGKRDRVPDIITESRLLNDLTMVLHVALGSPNPTMRSLFSQGWTEKEYFTSMINRYNILSMHVPISSLGRSEQYGTSGDFFNTLKSVSPIFKLLDTRINNLPQSLSLRFPPFIKSFKELISLRSKYQESMNALFTAGCFAWGTTGIPLNNVVDFSSIRDNTLFNRQFNASSGNIAPIHIELKRRIKYAPDLFSSFGEKMNGLMTQCMGDEINPQVDPYQSPPIPPLLGTILPERRTSDNLPSYIKAIVDSFSTSTTNLSSAKTKTSGHVNVTNSATSFRRGYVMFPMLVALDTAISYTIFTVSGRYRCLVPTSITPMRSLPVGTQEPAVHAFNSIVTCGSSLKDYMVKVTTVSRSSTSVSPYVSLKDHNIPLDILCEGNELNLITYCSRIDVTGNAKKIPVAPGKYPLHCFYLLSQINAIAKNSGNNDVENLISTEYQSILTALSEDEIPYDAYPEDPVLNEVKIIRTIPTIDSVHGLSLEELSKRFSAALNVPNAIRSNDTSTITSYYSSVSRHCAVPPMSRVQPTGIQNLL